MVLHTPPAPCWRPVPALRCRWAVRASAHRQSPKSQPSRENDVLARIRRVKQRLPQPEGQAPAGGEAAAAQPEVPGVPLASALPLAGPDAAERFASAADAAAGKEQQAFVEALRESAQSPSAQAPTAVQPPILGNSPAAMRARLAKARAYKASKTTATAAPALPALAVPAPPAAAPSDSAGPEGSAGQAAGFLRDVLAGSSGAADAALSPEQFSLKREADMRARGAEIITIDAPREGAEGGEPAAAAAAYRPKVATWGVFPRPANISREFGGGRTLRPGEALESAEVREARRARVAAAMANYRKDQGLVIEASVAVAAETALAAGSTYMAAGNLAEALESFCEAAAGVPLRSALGGQATLQRAICLDSMGRAAEAKVLYQAVKGHPSPTVAKRARQMLFGFQAMDNLKTHTISYSVGSAYNEYFNRLSGQWASYVAPEGREDSSSSLSALVATALLLAPLLAIGAKISTRVLVK